MRVLALLLCLFASQALAADAMPAPKGTFLLQPDRATW